MKSYISAKRLARIILNLQFSHCIVGNSGGSYKERSQRQLWHQDRSRNGEWTRSVNQGLCDEPISHSKNFTKGIGNYIALNTAHFS
jgi:hypothetical protein